MMMAPEDITIELMLAQVGAFFIVVAEAVSEKYVIRMKSPDTFNYKNNNKKEHQWSAIHFTTIAMTISVVFALLANITFAQWLLLFCSFLMTRWIVFNTMLNFLREIDIFYLSDSGIDGFVKKKLGKSYGVKNFIISLVLFLILNIILWCTLV